MTGSPSTRTRWVAVAFACLLVVSGTVGVAAAGVAAAGVSPTESTDAAALESTTAVDTSVAGTDASAAPVRPQTAVVRGRPDLEVMLPDSTVTPGQTNDVALQIANDGTLNFGSAENRDIVTTARNVRVEADAEGTPLTVETGMQGIGSVTTDQPSEFSVDVDVPQSVETGTYDVDVEVRYSYRSFQGGESVGSSANERTRTITETIEVEVKDEARFDIVDAQTDAQVGDSGTLEAVIENTGSEPAIDADVTLEAAGEFSFSGTQSSTARISRLEPGERATVTYDVAVESDSTVRQYSLSGQVEFDDPEGITRVDESISLGVAPRAEQTFRIESGETTIRVGEDGDLEGTVTNEGPAPARNVVVVYESESSNVIPIENEVAVGSLDPDESADFALPVEIGGEAEAVDRVADVAVRYRNDENELRRYEDVEIAYGVGEERDDFTVEVVDREVTAGSTTTFDIVVTNNLDEPVSDIEARLFADSPLDSPEDEGFAESLAPGESTNMTFTLAADGGATAKTYPVSMDFRYDDADGDSTLSDTTRVAVRVVESEGGFPFITVLGVVAAVTVVGGAVYYRQSE